MNAIEKAKIGRDVANYIIEHLLVDQPIPTDEMESTVIAVTTERVDADAHEITEIVTFATTYLRTDPRVLFAAREGSKPVYFLSSRSI